MNDSTFHDIYSKRRSLFFVFVLFFFKLRSIFFSIESCDFTTKVIVSRLSECCTRCLSVRISKFSFFFLREFISATLPFASKFFPK